MLVTFHPVTFLYIENAMNNIIYSYKTHSGKHLVIKF